MRHCKRCSKSVCDTCSQNKRRLSRKDKKEYRVCDRCDTIIDNFQITEEQT